MFCVYKNTLLVNVDFFTENARFCVDTCIFRLREGRYSFALSVFFSEVHKVLNDTIASNRTVKDVSCK